MARFSQIEPSLACGDEAFRTCLKAVGFRLFLVVQFNEFQKRLFNPPDRIGDAAPEPASIKWILCVKAATSIIRHQLHIKIRNHSKSVRRVVRYLYKFRSRAIDQYRYMKCPVVLTVSTDTSLSIWLKKATNSQIQ